MAPLRRGQGRSWLAKPLAGVYLTMTPSFFPNPVFISTRHLHPFEEEWIFSATERSATWREGDENHHPRFRSEASQPLMVKMRGGD